MAKKGRSTAPPRVVTREATLENPQKVKIEVALYPARIARHVQFLRRQIRLPDAAWVQTTGIPLQHLKAMEANTPLAPMNLYQALENTREALLTEAVSQLQFLRAFKRKWCCLRSQCPRRRAK